MDTTPSFISAKAADVILSDVRPTSITPDALRSVNILLDELLWLILAHARSFETSRLKSGVLKAIPTQLGKDAILEAEIEIRAYRDKVQGRLRGPRPTDDANATFPLQEAFDYLRYKGQVLSSFGDVDEDVLTEGRLLEGYRNASHIPAAQDFAEAAPLYVTAVIEYVAQHLLSNIAQVVARDSSRTSADLQNLFTSLCENSLIYPVFKSMKVKSHIVQHLELPQTSSLSRKKSFNPAGQLATPSLSSASSTSNGTRGVPPSSFSRSSDVGNPAPSHTGGSAPSPNNSNGHEQGRQSPARISGGRASHESRRGAPANGALQRSFSLISGGHGSEGGRGPSVDGASAHSSKMTVFDELLESGGTMKVSLTPDRMRTFDVTKDKSGRATATNLASSLPQSASTTLRTDHLQPATIATNVSRQGTASPDSGPTSAVSYRGNSAPPSAFPTPDSPSDASRRTRFRDDELPPLPLSRVPIPAQRRASGSNIQQSLSASTRSSPATSVPPVAFPGVGSIGRSPKKNRANESDSLDDLTNGDDLSDDEPVQTNNSLRLTVPRAELSASTSSSSLSRSRTIKLSQTAQDLMDFLDSGPPEPPNGPAPPSDRPLNTPVSPKKSGGIFLSMVSRLRRGSSNEKILTRTRSFERLGSSTSRRGASTPIETHSSPQISGVPGQIHRHRSQINLSTSPKAPPSSWTPPLPAPPKPPTPPQPAPLQPIPQQQTVSGRVALESSKRSAATAEPSPLPSPVSIQFGLGGNKEEAVELPPVTGLTRGSSLRSKQFGSVPAQMGNNAPTSNGASLNRSTTRKTSTRALDDSTHQSTPMSTSPVAPARFPLRKASREAAVAAAGAVMAGGIGETFQVTPPAADNSKVVHRPQTPTSPTVDARGRPIAEASEARGDASECKPETVDIVVAPHSRTSASPAPSITPSSLGDDLTERAAQLRKMLAAAKHVEEARLLVDMFFIQMGLAMPSNDDPNPEEKSLLGVSRGYPTCSDFSISETEVNESERSVVEILLGDSPSYTPASSSTPAAESSSELADVA